MASTYSSQLRLELMADGENSGTWGSKTNTGLNLIEDAIAGMATVAVTGGAYSLTTNNAAADEARNLGLKFTGTLTSNSTITIPSVAKLYVVWNATSGAFTLSLKTSGGSATAVTQGSKFVMWCDGTEVYVLATGAGSGDFTTLTASSTTTLSALLDISGASAGQIKFPASQNASSNANTLDDYEEGSWTPAYSPSSGAFGAIAYSNQEGVYTKIGRLVTITGFISTNGITVGTASGAVYISGLPFAAGSASGNDAMNISYSGSWTSNTPLSGQCINNSTIQLLYNTSGLNSATQVSDMNTGASGKNALRFTATYYV